MILTRLRRRLSLGSKTLPTSWKTMSCHTPRKRARSCMPMKSISIELPYHAAQAGRTIRYEAVSSMTHTDNRANQEPSADLDLVLQLRERERQLESLLGHLPGL